MITYETSINNNKKCVINKRPLIESIVERATMDLTLGSTYLSTLTSNRHIQHINQTTTNLIQIKCLFNLRYSYYLPSKIFKNDKNLTRMIESKNSISPTGLLAQNMGCLVPGFKQNVTLERTNANNFSLVLYEGIKIYQSVFAEIKTHGFNPNNRKYQSKQNTTGSWQLSIF